jgi:predicted transport protein
MPLFRVVKEQVTPIAHSAFVSEKELQTLVERNLGAIFDCRFVASEFLTGAVHSGRIDTLALSEDDNPVIIEYKKAASSELVLQSLFYLNWLLDHQGDFDVAAHKALGPKIEIDWSTIRVICIAPSYKRYDQHAVRTMARGIELWSYRRFTNDTLYLEQIVQSDPEPIRSANAGGKNPVMVAAGKKAAVTRKTSTWTVEERLKDKTSAIRELFFGVQEFMQSLDIAIEEAPKKLYVAYRITQNILCVEVQKRKLLLYVKLDPKKYAGPAEISRDVSKIGHFGTGDLEITIRSEADLELAKPFLRLAYEKVGG